MTASVVVTGDSNGKSNGNGNGKSNGNGNGKSKSKSNGKEHKAIVLRVSGSRTGMTTAESTVAQDDTSIGGSSSQVPWRF